MVLSSFLCCIFLGSPLVIRDSGYIATRLPTNAEGVRNVHRNDGLSTTVCAILCIDYRTTTTTKNRINQATQKRCWGQRQEKRCRHDQSRRSYADRAQLLSTTAVYILATYHLVTLQHITSTLRWPRFLQGTRFRNNGLPLQWWKLGGGSTAQVNDPTYTVSKQAF